MNIRPLPFIAMAALCAIPVASQAESFAKFYKAYIPKLQRAFKTSDVKFFDAGTTSDFTDTSEGHTLTKAQSLGQMKQEGAMASNVEVTISMLSAKQTGDTATARTLTKAKMTMKPGSDKKSHVMYVEETATEHFVKSGSTWKLRSLVEDNPTKFTMDGKKMDPSKMGG